MTTLETTPVVGDPALEDDAPIYSHIVGPIYNDNGTKIRGADRIMEARINGTPVEALCGFVWVPSRDPECHPVCPRCEAIVQRGGE